MSKKNNPPISGGLKNFTKLKKQPTRWGPLTTISGIPSYACLQPWLNRVCWGCTYLITRGPLLVFLRRPKKHLVPCLPCPKFSLGEGELQQLPVSWLIGSGQIGHLLLGLGFSCTKFTFLESQAKTWCFGSFYFWDIFCSGSIQLSREDIIWNRSH